MNAITPFVFDAQTVRVVDRDGEPWFVLADVCRVLGIANARDAAARLDPDERDEVGLTDTIGREQRVTIVNEPGMYRLTMRSRRPEAQALAKFMYSVVMPSIRKTGSFGGGSVSLPRDPRELLAFIAQQAGDMVGLQDAVDELTPKAAALDRLTDASGLFCIQDAAKALNVPPKRLFAWLEAHRWIYRRTPASPLVAFEPPRRSGLLVHKGAWVPVPGRPDRFREQVMVTPKGLARLAELDAGK